MDFDGGLKPDDAELVKTGGFGEAVVALNLGLIDASAIARSVWSKNKSQFRVLVAGDVLPPLCNVIGVTTGEAAATKGDFIRAVLRGRRKAVDSCRRIPTRPRTSWPRPTISTSRSPGARSTTWSRPANPACPIEYGNFDFAGMDRMIRAQKLVGALSGDVEWSKIVDEGFPAV